MPLLAATNVRVVYGQDVILDGATLVVEPADRVGLVGRNGSGKTTMLKVMAGLVSPDAGDVARQRGIRIGYLSQDPDVDRSRSLREEAAAGMADLALLHTRLEQVFEEMAGAEGERLERLLKQQADLEHRIEAAGGYAVDHRIEAVLHGLGFVDAQFELNVGALSGGQLARLGLAKLLLQEPDLLLLDEPTNHLDITGRLWLESFLADEYSGSVVMVSHDRYLLDRVVTRIEEVEQGRLIDYPGNYTTFRKLRTERKKTQARAFEKQQTKFRQEEAFIRKYKAGQRAKQARGRESRLEREKQAAIDRPVEAANLRFELPKAERTGELVAVMRGGSKKYGGTVLRGALVDEESGGDHGSESRATKVLFDGLDVTIGRGERWGIIGPNGAGKTTFVRCMLGELPLDSGTVRLGTNVKIGYFAQVSADDQSESPVFRYLQDAIRRENPGSMLSEQQARDLAGAFLFSGSDQERPLNEMSGGERGRARLAALLASSKNLLVLDEPTNHLDIESAERLEEALSGDSGSYEGTLIVISHDRALIDATCDNLLVLDGRGGATVFHGNYSEWHAREQAAAGGGAKAAAAKAGREASAPAAAVGAAAAAGRTAGAVGAGKVKTSFSWMPVERLEKEIERQEKELRVLDEQLGRPEVYGDAGKCRQVLAERDRVQEELESLEAEWLRRAED